MTLAGTNVKCKPCPHLTSLNCRQTMMLQNGSALLPSQAFKVPQMPFSSSSSRLGLSLANRFGEKPYLAWSLRAWKPQTLARRDCETMSQKNQILQIAAGTCCLCQKNGLIRVRRWGQVWGSTWICTPWNAVGA